MVSQVINKSLRFHGNYTFTLSTVVSLWYCFYIQFVFRDLVDKIVKSLVLEPCTERGCADESMKPWSIAQWLPLSYNLLHGLGLRLLWRKDHQIAICTLKTLQCCICAFVFVVLSFGSMSWRTSVQMSLSASWHDCESRHWWYLQLRGFGADLRGSGEKQHHAAFERKTDVPIKRPNSAIVKQSCFETLQNSAQCGVKLFEPFNAAAAPILSHPGGGRLQRQSCAKSNNITQRSDQLFLNVDSKSGMLTANI